MTLTRTRPDPLDRPPGPESPVAPPGPWTRSILAALVRTMRACRQRRRSERALRQKGGRPC